MRRRRLFVYGSLREVSRRAALLSRRGQVIRVTPANLPGFRMLVSPLGDWPLLHRSPKSIVAGELLEGLTAADWRRLGRYEGSEYRLASVRVKIASGEWRSAYAYFPRRAKAGGRSWDFDHWRLRCYPEALAGR